MGPVMKKLKTSVSKNEPSIPYFCRNGLKGGRGYAISREIKKPKMATFGIKWDNKRLTCDVNMYKCTFVKFVCLGPMGTARSGWPCPK